MAWVPPSTVRRGIGLCAPVANVTLVPEQYVWFAWASAFLIPWCALFLTLPAQRAAMWWASLCTMPLGLTEPLFVPEYWSPPSLFDFARRTGFDVESLIFSFGIGGIGSVLYSALVRARTVPVPERERRRPLHKHHYAAIAAPLLAFPPLIVLPWNPIYPAIAAMTIGAFANIACRPDLRRKTWAGGLLFLAYYWVFLVGLEWLSPGYIDRVWNLSALSGLMIWRIPLEELLFAAAFGLYWAGVYEHLTWRGLAPDHG